ncbi:hypothetical protein CCR95_14985 [Thiocystis minor]|uniref:glycosyltransferase family 9 protein n=1 Tax=Thiocystis minor TaxID=61597 RepID=UPI0019120D45|nr:glycosyltransferase family 9 protein [Thiocystis minor]MBK5965355.1 hypothetical protein [Thiocystis minor]
MSDASIPTPVEIGRSRLLIVRLSALGDTALTLPLAFMLKERCPNLHLGWVVGARAAPLLSGIDCIDQLHVMPRPSYDMAGRWRLLREIRAQGYQAALDPQGITRSALVPWLAGIPKRIGFVPGPLESRELAPLFFNHFVRIPPGVRHITDRTLYLASALGIDPRRQPACSVSPDPAAEQRIDRWWGEEGLMPNTLILGIGAGWPTRVWPPGRLRDLIRAAGERGVRTVVLWGPAECRFLDDWRDLFGQTVSFAQATDIQGMLALLKKGRCYAGPDSSPLHLAWLLGKPTFSWFGASDPARCAPRGPGHVHVARGPHHWRRTSLLGNPLAGLGVDDVLPSFHAWLDGLDGIQTN